MSRRDREEDMIDSVDRHRDDEFEGVDFTYVELLVKNSKGIPVRLIQRDIDDILCTAFEGGITYWCSGVTVIGSFLGTYASEQIARGGELLIIDEEENKPYPLTLTKFIKGITEYMVKYNMDFVQEDGTIDAGDIDAEVADGIVQMAVFGDIVYG